MSDLLTRLETQLLLQLQEIQGDSYIPSKPLFANELQDLLGKHGHPPVDARLLPSLLKRLPPRGMETQLDIQSWLGENSTMLEEVEKEKQEKQEKQINSNSKDTLNANTIKDGAQKGLGSPGMERLKQKANSGAVTELMDLLDAKSPDLGALFLMKDEKCLGNVRTTEFIEIMTAMDMCEPYTLGLLRKATENLSGKEIPYPEWLQQTTPKKRAKEEKDRKDAEAMQEKIDREARQEKEKADKEEAERIEQERIEKEEENKRLEKEKEDAEKALKEQEIEEQKQEEEKEKQDTGAKKEDAEAEKAEELLNIELEDSLAPKSEAVRASEKSKIGDGGEADSLQEGEHTAGADESNVDGDGSNVDAQTDGQTDDIDGAQGQVEGRSKGESGADESNMDELATGPVGQAEELLNGDEVFEESPRKQSFSEPTKNQDAEIQADHRVASAKQRENLIMTNMPSPPEKRGGNLCGLNQPISMNGNLDGNPINQRGIPGFQNSALEATPTDGFSPLNNPYNAATLTDSRRNQDGFRGAPLFPSVGLSPQHYTKTRALLMSSDNVPFHPNLQSERYIARECTRFFRSVEVIDNTTVYTEAVTVDEDITGASAEARIDWHVQTGKIRKASAVGEGGYRSYFNDQHQIGDHFAQGNGGYFDPNETRDLSPKANELNVNANDFYNSNEAEFMRKHGWNLGNPNQRPFQAVYNGHHQDESDGQLFPFPSGLPGYRQQDLVSYGEDSPKTSFLRNVAPQPRMMDQKILINNSSNYSVPMMSMAHEAPNAIDASENLASIKKMRAAKKPNAHGDPGSDQNIPIENHSVTEAPNTVDASENLASIKRMRAANKKTYLEGSHYQEDRATSDAGGDTNPDPSEGNDNIANDASESLASMKRKRAAEKTNKNAENIAEREASCSKIAGRICANLTDDYGIQKIVNPAVSNLHKQKIAIEKALKDQAKAEETHRQEQEQVVQMERQRQLDLVEQQKKVFAEQQKLEWMASGVVDSAQILGETAKDLGMNGLNNGPNSPYEPNSLPKQVGNLDQTLHMVQPTASNVFSQEMHMRRDSAMQFFHFEDDFSENSQSCGRQLAKHRVEWMSASGMILGGEVHSDGTASGTMGGSTLGSANPYFCSTRGSNLAFVLPPKLFVALQGSDVEEGLGNSGLVQALRVICDRAPELIKRVFDSAGVDGNSSRGMIREAIAGADGPYCLQLFHPFKNWSREGVVVNDLVPTIDGICLFSTNRNGELWSYLLEKGIAKMLGGYQNLPGLTLPQVWNILSGLQLDSSQNSNGCDHNSNPFRVLFPWRPQKTVYNELGERFGNTGPDGIGGLQGIAGVVSQPTFGNNNNENRLFKNQAFSQTEKLDLSNNYHTISSAQNPLTPWAEGCFVKDLSSYAYREPADNCNTERDIIRYLSDMTQNHIVACTFLPENPFGVELGTYVTLWKVDVKSELVWCRAYVHPDCVFGNLFDRCVAEELEIREQAMFGVEIGDGCQDGSREEGHDDYYGRQGSGPGGSQSSSRRSSGIGTSSQQGSKPSSKKGSKPGSRQGSKLGSESNSKQGSKPNSHSGSQQSSRKASKTNPNLGDPPIDKSSSASYPFKDQDEIARRMKEHKKGVQDITKLENAKKIQSQVMSEIADIYDGRNPSGIIGPDGRVYRNSRAYGSTGSTNIGAFSQIIGPDGRPYGSTVTGGLDSANIIRDSAAQNTAAQYSARSSGSGGSKRGMESMGSGMIGSKAMQSMAVGVGSMNFGGSLAMKDSAALADFMTQSRGGGRASNERALSLMQSLEYANSPGGRRLLKEHQDMLQAGENAINAKRKEMEQGYDMLLEQRINEEERFRKFLNKLRSIKFIASEFQKKLYIQDRRKFAIPWKVFQTWVYDIIYTEHSISELTNKTHPTSWLEMAIYNTVVGLTGNYNSIQQQGGIMYGGMYGINFSSGITSPYKNSLNSSSGISNLMDKRDLTVYDIWKQLLRSEFSDRGIDQMRFYTIVNRFNPKLSERELRVIWDYSDRDKDSFLNYPEFFALFELARIFT